MIVPMKMLTLVCLDRHRDEMLAQLRGLGAVHVAHVKTPEGGELEAARARSALVQKALDAIPSCKKAPAACSGPGDSAGLLERVSALATRRKEHEGRLRDLENERRRIAPFGDFDPQAAKSLADSGVSVRLFQAQSQAGLELPADSVVAVLSETREGVAFAVIRRSQEDYTPKAGGVDALEARMPLRSLGEIGRAVEESKKIVAESDAALAGLSDQRGLLLTEAEKAIEGETLQEVRLGMGRADELAYLRGFLPVKRIPEFEKAAAKGGWGYALDEPSGADVPPTLLENPSWVRPVEQVFNSLGILPSYNCMDISWAYFVFLTIFFAMLVGDFCYGAIFFGITLLARLRFREAPSEPFTLVFVMSSATMAWGVMTGSYFAMTGLPSFLENLKVDWLTGDNSQANVIMMCFLIGAIHITLARLWSAFIMINSTRALAQIGWVCTTWAMFLVAKKMILNQPAGDAMHPWVMPLLGIGAGLIVIFMTPPRFFATEWFNHVVFPLDLVANFVDVVSYVRLFAVGCAGTAVAMAFNSIASEMGGPASVLVLILGHSLNLVLCVMGVLVHGIRLNTLEFSKHIGLEWGGMKYNPFAEQTSK